MPVTPISTNCRNQLILELDDMSMLTVTELLDDASLGLELVAGHRAADREIEAAAVSELSHPGPWLQGGELLLTIGLLLPDSIDGCRAYISELHDAGVRAVGLGLGAELPHQRAPDRLAAAADAHGMPLLTVPDGVPFIAVTKAVFAFRARAERQVWNERCRPSGRSPPPRSARVACWESSTHIATQPAARASSSISWAGCWHKPIPTAVAWSNRCRARSRRFETTG